MGKFLKSVVVAAGLVGLPAGAWAQAPVAVVEDVQGKVAGVEFMDYVAAGRVIKLGAKDSLVLGYLRSCWRETITGGTVTVGAEQSMVAQGKVVRAKVACDASRMQLSTREATQSAATVFRSLGPGQPPPKQALPAIYGQSPVIEVNASRGQLVIERTDESGERFEAAVAGPALLRDRFFDLARTDIALKPGGRYAASLGVLRVEFTIAWEAQPGATPLAGRLLRFE
jgi:hypothetical protein